MVEENYRIKFEKDSDTVQSVIEKLKSNPNVEYVEPNYIYKLESLPNDPRFSDQWAMQKIQAPQAWDITTGSQDVVIAVVDSGIDYTHEDIKNNM